jgi:hypothetical protein
MPLEALMEQIKTKQHSEIKKDKNLCKCELYDLGEHRLAVVFWHHLLGACYYAPGVKTDIITPSDSAITAVITEEVHSRQEMVGCIFDFLKFSRQTQGEVGAEILRRWRTLT